MFLYLNKPESEAVTNLNDNITLVEEEVIEDIVFADIKGEVKKPGVYEVSSGTIVNDIISLAGGLTKYATTKNINLSKKVTNEMVIIISTKKALDKVLTFNNTTCKCEDVIITECLTKDEVSIVSPTEGETPVVEEATTKISLNTATKDELMTLPGIGESKALNIISYRTTNGLFKSVEEVMDVTGIGESIFAQIKESITL